MKKRWKWTAAGLVVVLLSIWLVPRLASWPKFRPSACGIAWHKNRVPATPLPLLRWVVWRCPCLGIPVKDCHEIGCCGGG